MKLQALISPGELLVALADGHVKRQVHPSQPLAVLNYTQTAMWAKAWSPVTRQCRGLIYRTDTDEVVARPFPKFFNHGEPEAGELDLDEHAVVTDKLDGSLGVLYPLPGSGFGVATRGSFASPQAVHATELWHQKYSDFRPEPGWTYLFEIVFPGNRIVLDYGELDDLLCLTAVEISTGRSRIPEEWKGARARQFECSSLAEALRIPPRKNAEGVVIWFPRTEQRVKIKQDDYVALHRVLTGTSPRRIWEFLAVQACKHLVKESKHWGKTLGLDPERATEILAAGDQWLELMLTNVPDEFFKWVHDVTDHIRRETEALRADIVWVFQDLRTPDRKEFARRVQYKAFHVPALFLLFEDKDITAYLYKQVYPAAEKATSAWLSRSEDVA